MMPKIIEVIPLPEKFLYLKFSNGKDGFFCFEDYFPYKGFLRKLKKDDFFYKVAINQFGTLEWPGQIDFCPDVLYSIISKKKIFYKNKIVFDPEFPKF